VDLVAFRDRLTTTYRTRSEQARDLVDRVPILGRMVHEFARIEFIDRCMLIAAQGLLALIPMLVVLAAFLPRLTDIGIEQFTSVTGLGGTGSDQVSADVNIDQVRTQTGLFGLLITFFSATSFGRAVQRMYERIWDLPHIGGVVGTRRCFVWLIGWLLTVQLVAGLVRLIQVDGVVFGGFRLAVHIVLASAVWLVTSRLLLFGRVPWLMLVLGSALAGTLITLYSRGSRFFMPAYVDANADQFGTLGIILSISTWLIGFAGILVTSSLVGRIVSEDPTVRRVLSSTVAAVQEGWQRRPGRPPRPGRPGRPAGGPAAPPPAG
jgi:membrane protein